MYKIQVQFCQLYFCAHEPCFLSFNCKIIEQCDLYSDLQSVFLMLALLVKYIFLTAFYGLYFNHQYTLHYTIFPSFYMFMVTFCWQLLCTVIYPKKPKKLLQRFINWWCFAKQAKKFLLSFGAEFWSLRGGLHSIQMSQ